MSAKFEVEIVRDGSRLNVNFAGGLDESTQLPVIDLEGVKSARFDMGKFTSINSIGIRNFIVWKAAFDKANIPVDVENMTVSIVQQCNMVAGFLPKLANVRSVFVPHSCDDCSSEYLQLVQVHNGQPEAFEVKAVGKCKTGCLFQPDYAMQKYLKFAQPAKS